LFSRLWKPQALIQGLEHFKHMLYHEKLSDMEVKVLLKTELFQFKKKLLYLTNLCNICWLSEKSNTMTLFDLNVPLRVYKKLYPMYQDFIVMHSEIVNTCLSTSLCSLPHAGSRFVKTNSCILCYNVPKERSSFLILYKHFHKDSSLLGS